MNKAAFQQQKNFPKEIQIFVMHHRQVKVFKNNASSLTLGANKFWGWCWWYGKCSTFATKSRTFLLRLQWWLMFVLEFCRRNCTYRLNGGQIVDVSSVRQWVISFSSGDDDVSTKPHSWQPSTQWRATRSAHSRETSQRKTPLWMLEHISLHRLPKW